MLPESYKHANPGFSLNFSSDFCKQCYSFSSPAQVKHQKHLNILPIISLLTNAILMYSETFQITFVVSYIKSSHRFLFSYMGKFTCCSLYSNEIHSDKQGKNSQAETSFLITMAIMRAMLLESQSLSTSSDFWGRNKLLEIELLHHDLLRHSH